MEFGKYQKGAVTTIKPHKELTAKESAGLDWALGLAGEAGEVCEVIKHHVFHNESLDKMKLAKELGDCLWYIGAMCEELDIPMDACADLNLAKLQHRHQGKFSFTKSADRHAREEQFTDTQVYKDIKRRIVGD